MRSKTSVKLYARWSYSVWTSAMPQELTQVRLDKPDDLIFSPQLVSQAASYVLNAILLNERINSGDANREQKILARDVRLLIGADKSHNAAFLEKVLDELVSIKIKWGELLPSPDDQGDKMTVIVPFLQKAAYRSRSDGTVDPERGYITYKLSDPIFDIINNSLNMTNVQVLLQRQFERPYSYKLYEVFQSHLQKQQERKDVSIIYTIDYLKQLLGIEQSYPVFGDFNKYVLKPNIEEINSRADFSIEIKSLKKGKSVYALEFIIVRRYERMGVPSDMLREHEKLPKLLEMALTAKRQDQEREPALKRLSDYKIARKVANDFIDSLGLEEVEAIIERVDLDLSRGFKPRSRTAYMKSCLLGHSIPGQHEERAGVPPPLLAVYDQLREEFGLNETVALSICIDYPPDQVRSAVSYVQTQQRTGKPLGKGYLVAAIRGDYGRELRLSDPEAQRKADEIRQWMDQRSAEIYPARQEFMALAEQERDRLFDVFMESPPPGWGKNAQIDYKKNGLKGWYAADVFFHWYMKRKDKL